MVAIERALAAFQKKPSWRRLMRNGMAKDYGWAQPARAYVAVYKEAVQRRK
jgi:starch synthase